MPMSTTREHEDDLVRMNSPPAPTREDKAALTPAVKDLPLEDNVIAPNVPTLDDFWEQIAGTKPNVANATMSHAPATTGNLLETAAATEHREKADVNGQFEANSNSPFCDPLLEELSFPSPTIAAMPELSELPLTKDSIPKRIELWSKENEANLRALLVSLPSLMRPVLVLPATSLADLLTNSQVKSSYARAISLLHPDKLKVKAGADQEAAQLLAEQAFAILRQAWEVFRSKNVL